MRVSRFLLEGDLCASLFELSLGSLSVFLVCSLDDSLRCALDELLSFLQAQAGDELADNLDHADLLGASVFENDVELVLLFDSSLSASGTCSSNGDRSSSGDLEDLFEFLDELRELDEGHFLESLNELVLGELSHDGVLSVGASSRP